jgi:hypothetical protein
VGLRCHLKVAQARVKEVSKQAAAFKRLSLSNQKKASLTLVF